MEQIISEPKKYSGEPEYLSKVHVRNMRSFLRQKLKELFHKQRFSSSEKLLLHLILDLDKGEGCYASNEYLAELMNSNLNTIKWQISQLRKKDVLITVKFDGRKRWLKIKPLIRYGPPSFSSMENHDSTNPQNNGLPSLSSMENHFLTTKKESNKERNIIYDKIVYKEDDIRNHVFLEKNNSFFNSKTGASNSHAKENPPLTAAPPSLSDGAQVTNIAPAQVDYLINLFSNVNSFVNRLLNSKFQRQAIEDLVQKFGYTKIENLIMGLKNSNEEQYLPKIFTPYDLLLKIDKLFNASRLKVTQSKMSVTIL